VAVDYNNPELLRSPIILPFLRVGRVYSAISCVMFAHNLRRKRNFGVFFLMMSFRCEPFAVFFRQNRRKIGNLATLIVTLITPQAGFAGEAKTPTPLVRAETAVGKLAKGEWQEAVKQTSAALQFAPEDGLLHTLAGVLLLNSGDARAAQVAFERAILLSKADGLATYGKGLCQLSQGKPSEALQSFQVAERQGANATHLLLARRYAQWLTGAQISLSGAGLPEAFVPAQRSLEGMGFARQGDWKRALTELEAVQTGDQNSSPASGILLRFDAARPLGATQAALSAKHGLTAPLPKERAITGTVSIRPDNVTGDVAYVAYELDGQPLSLANSRPFDYTWDSRRASNGWHTLSITFYDSQGSDAGRQTRKLRSYNADVFGASGDSERQSLLQSALWDALTLRPDTAAVAYTAGIAYKTLGNVAKARSYLLKAAAFAPDYRDVRQQLAFCGGIAAPQEAIYGGLPTEKVIALTFDDGPKPGMTEPLLEILIKEKVPATFFVIGRHVIAYPELTRQITAAGMELANHSYTHPNLTKIGDAAVAREIMRTQAAIEQVTGKTSRFVRPPGGNWNNAVSKVCRDWGLIPCMWTVDVYGSEVIGAQSVADAVLMQVRPGSVILMHNGKMSTLQALPTVIKELKRRGYSFATVETMYNRLAAAKAAERQAAVAAANTNRRRGE